MDLWENRGNAGTKSGKKLEKVGYSNHSCLIYLPMDIPEILEFVDRAVYTETDKHLNNLQRRIIAGILKGQKYAELSKTYGYSSQHVKKVSHELLKILTDVFGEKVRKSNLESVLERHINVNITLGNKNSRNQNKVNIFSIKKCPDTSTATPQTSDSVPTEFPHHSKNQGQNPVNLETIEKLRLFGLKDEQIAEALQIPVDIVKQVNLDE